MLEHASLFWCLACSTCCNSEYLNVRSDLMAQMKRLSSRTFQRRLCSSSGVWSVWLMMAEPQMAVPSQSEYFHTMSGPDPARQRAGCKHNDQRPAATHSTKLMMELTNEPRGDISPSTCCRRLFICCWVSPKNNWNTDGMDKNQPVGGLMDSELLFPSTCLSESSFWNPFISVGVSSASSSHCSSPFVCLHLLSGGCLRMTRGWPGPDWRRRVGLTLEPEAPCGRVDQSALRFQAPVWRTADLQR